MAIARVTRVIIWKWLFCSAYLVGRARSNGLFFDTVSFSWKYESWLRVFVACSPCSRKFNLLSKWLKLLIKELKLRMYGWAVWISLSSVSVTGFIIGSMSMDSVAQAIRMPLVALRPIFVSLWTPGSNFLPLWEKEKPESAVLVRFEMVIGLDEDMRIKVGFLITMHEEDVLISLCEQELCSDPMDIKQCPA